MIVRITLSHILVFFLVSSAVDAQSASQQAASPNISLHEWDPSFAPVVVALGCAFLFIGCFSIYLRHCSDIDLEAARDSRGTTAANCSSHGPRGIDPKLLNTFPILVYSAVKPIKLGSAALGCAVCLSEFEHQDTLRLLPKCNHVFHPECIDAWLASHVTCPVCRATLKPEHHHGDKKEVVIVIPNEVSAHQEFDESSGSGTTELSSGERRSLGRCHSTGHSLGLVGTVGKDTERYTLRLSEDVRKQIMANRGGIRHSASCDVLWGRPSEGSSSERFVP